MRLELIRRLVRNIHSTDEGPIDPNIFFEMMVEKILKGSGHIVKLQDRTH